MKIQRFVRPESLEHAYSLLRDEKAFLIGGGAWSRMNSRKVDLAVDLSSLDLCFIRNKERKLEIGAMSTARDVERSKEVQDVLGSMLSDTLAHIVGVQLRNIVTVGGTVAGKYGFSDLLTSLMALDAKVVLHDEKELPLEDFLSTQTKDPRIVTKIVVETGELKGSYKSVRRSSTDFPSLNAAAVRRGKEWRIAVGARPAGAQLAAKACAKLKGVSPISKEMVETVGKTAANELSFGSDIRGSAEYRRQICEVLVKRVIEEVVK